MMDNQTESPWYIFINGGDRMYLLGKDGGYLTENSKEMAMAFKEKINAIEDVERRGLERLATIRKVSAAVTSQYNSICCKKRKAVE